MLGRPLRASGLPAPVAGWLREAWSFPQHAPPAQTYQIQIDCPPALTGLDGPPGAQPHDLEIMGLPLRVEVAGEQFVYRGAGGALHCAHTPDGTLIRMGWSAPAAGAAAEQELGSLVLALHLAITEGLRLSGLLPLHASSAVGPDGACAFLGPSGRGKTTTLLRALLAGWTPLSEDILWLDMGSQLAYGWDRALRLLPDSLKLLPPEVTPPPAGWPVSADGKAEVPITAFGAGAASAAPLTALALLERAPGEPSGWAPWDARAAIPELWDACGLPLSAQAQRRAADLIGQVARRIPLKRLRLGDTPLPL